MRYPDEVERRSDRMATVRHPDEVGCQLDINPDVRHPGGMSENFRLGGMSDATCSKGDVRMS